MCVPMTWFTIWAAAMAGWSLWRRSGLARAPSASRSFRTSAGKRRNASMRLGLSDRVQMMEDSVFHVDLSPATVVTMFFLTSSNERLKPNLEKYLKPGSRVVSNEFPIRGWRPTEVVHAKAGAMDHSIYVYQIGKTK